MKKSSNQSEDERITFRELTESSVPYYGSDSVSAPNPSDISFTESDMDPKFRSIQTSDISGGFNLMGRHELNSMMDVHSNRKGLDVASSGFSERFNDSMTLSKPEIVIERKQRNCGGIAVPRKPVYVSKTSVRTTKPLGQLVEQTEVALDKCSEVAYSFSSKDCKWDATYLKGSRRCHFEICVYQEGDEGILIVEGNRLCGDCMIFRSLFGSLKAELDPSKRSSSAMPMDLSSEFSSFTMPLSSLEDMPMGPPPQLSTQDTALALRPIVDMARSSQVDAKIESARIMCDISLRSELHGAMCEAGCISALVGLMQIDHEWCNQHAVCALANVSTSRPCQDVLVSDPSFFPALMKLVSDGSHSSVEMRRECARTLANLCAGFGPRIVNAVGVDAASKWVNSVESIHDSRLKVHAERARAFLLPALQCT